MLNYLISGKSKTVLSFKKNKTTALNIAIFSSFYSSEKRQTAAGKGLWEIKHGKRT